MVHMINSMRCEPVEPWDYSEIHQGHGNHFSAFFGPDDYQNILDECLEPIVKKSSVAQRVRTEVCTGDETRTADVFGMTFAEGDIKLSSILVSQEEDKSLEFATIYPSLAGITHKVTVKRVIEWDNKLEAAIECSIGDFTFAFFATDYYANKAVYQPGMELDINLAMLAERAEHAEVGFKFEGQKAIDWLTRMGMEIEYDDDGNVVPVEFSYAELVFFSRSDKELPDEGEFHSPIHNVEKVDHMGLTFMKLTISLTNQADDVHVPLYYRNGLLEDLDPDRPVHGWAWIVGKIELKMQ